MLNTKEVVAMHTPLYHNMVIDDYYSYKAILHLIHVKCATCEVGLHLTEQFSGFSEQSEWSDILEIGGTDNGETNILFTYLSYYLWHFFLMDLYQEVCKNVP